MSQITKKELIEMLAKAPDDAVVEFNILGGASYFRGQAQPNLRERPHISAQYLAPYAIITIDRRGD